MDTNEFEYYIVDANDNGQYPLLVVTENEDYEFEEEMIEDPEPMTYVLGEPVPKKPVMADYHFSERSVISKKIYDALVHKNIEGIQFIPAVIIGKKDEIYEDYFYFHIYNYLSVMDKEKSIYKWMKTANVANPIDKLVLNQKALEEIPLEKRLIFRLRENDTFELFHKSIVDTIMATEPKGIRFTKVENWNISTSFK